VRRQIRRVYDRFMVENDLGWRWASNLGPTLSYRRAKGAASPVTERIVTTLRRDGVAISSLAELGIDDALVARLRTRVDELLSDAKDEIDDKARRLPDASAHGSKPFLVELMGALPAVRPGDPVLDFVLDPRVRGVAEAYSGMTLRVHDVNVWYNLPWPGEAQQSQRWHRDLFEDHDIVKVFLYVREVTPGSGPLSYLVGSHRGERRRWDPPTTYDGIGYRVDGAAIEAAAGPGEIVTAPGPQGTVVFADTRGLHRGGWATTDPRVVLQGLYASRSVRRPGTLVVADERSRTELLRDVNVLSSEQQKVREAAVGVG
jgi:hypothetical protein